MVTDFRWTSAVIAFAAIGAINWGMVGLLDFNLVTTLLGETPSGAASTASRMAYGLVGISGLAAIALAFTARVAFPLRAPARR